MSNLEDDRFVCKHCEKVIRYERPLFCPYCGTKIDPVDGLDTQDGEIKIYRWSGIAPTLVWLLTIWMILVVPVALLWGRGGIFYLTWLFALSVFIFAALSFFLTYQRRN